MPSRLLPLPASFPTPLPSQISKIVLCIIRHPGTNFEIEEMYFCACLVSNVYSYVILPEHFEVPDVFFRKRIWIRKLPSLGASVNPTMTFAHSTWDQCYRPTICLGKWVFTAGCCFFPLARSDPELGSWPPSLSRPQRLKLCTRVKMETPALLWQLPSCRNQVWICLLVFLIHLAAWVSLSAIGGARDHSVFSGLSLLICEMGAACYSPPYPSPACLASSLSYFALLVNNSEVKLHGFK